MLSIRFHSSDTSHLHVANARDAGAPDDVFGEVDLCRRFLDPDRHLGVAGPASGALDKLGQVFDLLPPKLCTCVWSW